MVMARMWNSALLTVMGIGYLIGGLIITESVFGYPGLGRLFVWSIQRRDLVLVQSCCMIVVSIYVPVHGYVGHPAIVKGALTPVDDRVLDKGLEPCLLGLLNTHRELLLSTGSCRIFLLTRSSSTSSKPHRRSSSAVGIPDFRSIPLMVYHSFRTRS